jgi:putative restriction endonuclease
VPYANRCAVCVLREPALLQAAHIIDDRDAGGAATVINGISLCAIHHLAYDRNLLGIDPIGVVHIARRLLDEADGPMLRAGLQGFHGATILQPDRVEERPDPKRLELRFTHFNAAVGLVSERLALCQRPSASVIPMGDPGPREPQAERRPQRWIDADLPPPP